MSLADLYKDDLNLEDDGSGDEGSQDEFVPGEAGEDGSDGESDIESNASESGNEGASSAGDEEKAAGDAIRAEQEKQRIDAIWQEMKAAIPGKETEPSEPEPPGDGSRENDREEKKENPEPRKPKKRKASKFSQLAEQVEKRRGKNETTLDKARREWTGFVHQEGIREDLDRANKDGYVERQEFLQRVDERTYKQTKNQKY
ncbi:hypothetical protein GGI07_002055 [Coemansia sp. Benny D115]|nr:hypothetical protein GGI07_002055 [Coemansia sp. Benny D115]